MKIKNLIRQVRVHLEQENIEELCDPERGVTAVKLSGPVSELIAELSAQAADLTYRIAMPNTPTKVTQNFGSCGDFQPQSPWACLGRQISGELELGFKRAGSDELISLPLDLSDLSVQQYPQNREGENYGISPHRDQAGFINLVAVLLIRGPSAFFICKDKEANGSVEIHANPGDLILMRGGGFAKGLLSRPFHYVERIDNPEGRLTFGMRQITSDPVVRERILDVFGK